jgi:hypothetical protein
MNQKQIENEILKISSQPEKTRLSFRLFSRLERLLFAVNFNLRKKISLADLSQGTGTFSESLQDKFALKIGNLSGLNTYIEIGAGHPVKGNNTFLLEQKGWKGFSIELDPELVNVFANLRKNPVYSDDGTEFDYLAAINDLNLGLNISYLQVDIDPSVQSLKTLLKIPFDAHKFAAITFEHDAYRSDSKIRELQRKYLLGFGYVLIASNVKVNRFFAYEDWWVHPDLINLAEIEYFKSHNKHPFKMTWDNSLAHK